MRCANLFYGLGLACLLSSTAMANPVIVSQSNLFANGSADVTIVNFAGTDKQTKQNVRAGQFTLDVLDVATQAVSIVQAYCVDIFHSLSLPSNYKIGALSDTLKDNVKLGQIQAVIDNVSLVANDAAKSAAAQIAIWEILYETSGEYSTSGGSFQARNSTGDVFAYASEFLKAVTVGTWTARDGRYVAELQTSSSSQNLAYTTVPEPASLALLGAGLVGVGLIRRRKTAA